MVLPKPVRISVGDHLTVRNKTHLVVPNYTGPKGGAAWIKDLRTVCNSHRFHRRQYDRSTEPVSCLVCLMHASAVP
jgi:hypothetical protein